MQRVLQSTCTMATYGRPLGIPQVITWRRPHPLAPLLDVRLHSLREW